MRSSPVRCPVPKGMACKRWGSTGSRSISACTFTSSEITTTASAVRGARSERFAVQPAILPVLVVGAVPVGDQIVDRHDDTVGHGPPPVHREPLVRLHHPVGHVAMPEPFQRVEVDGTGDDLGHRQGLGRVRRECRTGAPPRPRARRRAGSGPPRWPGSRPGCPFRAGPGRTRRRRHADPAPWSGPNRGRAPAEPWSSSPRGRRTPPRSDRTCESSAALSGSRSSSVPILAVRPRRPGDGRRRSSRRGGG